MRAGSLIEAKSATGGGVQPATMAALACLSVPDQQLEKGERGWQIAIAAQIHVIHLLSS
jgi:hypothetical protein